MTRLVVIAALVGACGGRGTLAVDPDDDVFATIPVTGTVTNTDGEVGTTGADTAAADTGTDVPGGETGAPDATTDTGATPPTGPVPTYDGAYEGTVVLECESPTVPPVSDTCTGTVSLVVSEGAVPLIAGSASCTFGGALVGQGGASDVEGNFTTAPAVEGAIGTAAWGGSFDDYDGVAYRSLSGTWTRQITASIAGLGDRDFDCTGDFLADRL